MAGTDYSGSTIPEIQDAINNSQLGIDMRGAISELTGRLVTTTSAAIEGYEDAQAEAASAAAAANAAASSVNAVVTNMGNVVLVVGGTQPSPISGKTVLWINA